MANTRLSVVFHSGYGHTARLAQAVGGGAAGVDGVEAQVLSAEEAPKRWSELEASDAIVFGAPTYMGSVSAGFKAFMEASARAVMAKGFVWNGKLAAGFTNSGAHAGDKLSTLMQLALFAAQHGMHWVNLGLPPPDNSSQGTGRDLNRLGFWLGAGAQSNTDQGPELVPPEPDLLTAEHLGRRVAHVALQLARGRA